MPEQPADPMTVADVLATPVLRAAGPQVLAGESGLERRVRWVHSAELADIAALLREGDLLLSTGIAMPDTPAELDAFASSLAEIGAAGLVIELGRRWRQLPRSLVQGCDRLGLPLVALTTEVRFAAIVQEVGESLVAAQLAQLRDAQRVHDTFTELSIAEADPQEILAAAQRLSGCTIVLENEEHQVLDYRPGPGDVEGQLARWSVRSRRVPSPGRTTWDADQSWLVTRVGRRDRRWGRLVILTSEPPSPRMVALLERAAAALALHRLHDRHRDSVVRRTHHELLVALLADPGSPDLLRRCSVAGLPTERRQLVGVTVRPRPHGSSGPRMAATDDLLAAAVHATHEAHVPALVCELDHDVRLLLSLPRSANARRAVESLADRIGRRGTVVVGAGRPVTRGAEVDRTLREAHQVAQAVPDGGAGVHWLQDVHLRGLLALLSADERLGLFVDRELAALRAHDATHGTNLEDAVRALLEHPTSKAAAAAALHLSRPVFYDRIAKAGAILDVDLDDPHIRTSLHVALLATQLDSGAD